MIKYKGKFIDMNEIDGWEFVSRKDNTEVVSIIATTRKNEIILVKQFREAIGKYVIEFPAGLIDKGETVTNAALRELKEETGEIAFANNCSIDGPYTKSPGLSNEISYVAYVNIDHFEKQELKDEEKIEVIKLNAYTDSINIFLRSMSNDTILNNTVAIYLEMEKRINKEIEFCEEY